MRVSRLALIPAVATVAACSNSDSPTGPSAGGNMSAAASAYLTRALDFEESVFLYANRIDWRALRTDVANQVPDAQVPRDTHKGISYSIERYFRPLGDNHSAFWVPETAPGRTDSPPNNPLYLVQGQMIGKVAYLYVPTYSGLNPRGRADSTLAKIRELDANGPCAWILDVRNNPGGTWAAMFAGLNPLVGNGQFAGLVDGGNNKAYFYVENGEAGIYDPSTRQNYPQVRASSTYTLNRPNPPVALLQGPLTASAGEIILLSFKGTTSPVRTFGTNSSGDTTVPAGTYLPPDSAYLNITAAVMFDRTNKVYGGVVSPDQVIASDTTSVRTPGARDVSTTAALAWLATQAACSGAAVEAPASRATPDRSAFPQSAPARTRPLNVSPYFFGRMSALD